MSIAYQTKKLVFVLTISIQITKAYEKAYVKALISIINSFIALLKYIPYIYYLI